MGVISQAAKAAAKGTKGLGQRAAEAAMKAKPSARDKAIIEAAAASKRGFLNPSKEKDVWYHGTTKDITEFDPGKRGAIFVTKDTEFASDYAPSEAIGLGKELSTQPNVMPVHVQARNPFDYENPEHIEAVMSAARFPRGINPQVARDNLELGNYNFIEDQNIQKAIKDLGFDSFYVKEYGLKNLGVYEPTQLKSAIGMQGSYDITNPDITKAEGGTVSPEGIPPIVSDLEAQYQAYKTGGQVESRPCKDFDEQLGKMIDFHAKLGGLVENYAKGGAVKMAPGGSATMEELGIEEDSLDVVPVSDEIAYMAEALSPERESEDSARAKKLRAMIKAGKIIATAVPKALAAPVVGVYGSATSGKFGTAEGVRAGEAAMEKFSELSEEQQQELENDPLAKEYLMDTERFMRELETKYKLPPLMPELFGPTMGTRGVGTQVKGLAKEAANKARDMAKELPPLPVGLSTEAAGKPVSEVLATTKPKAEEIKAPANQLGLYSATEKAALNLQRKQGTGDAFLNDLKKLGASKEELEYSGMEDFLKGKKNVTKDDIQDFAQNNRYELSEVEYRQGRGSNEDLEFDGDAIDDPDYISDRADDMYRNFDDYYGAERKQEITDEIESNYSPDELADPGIRKDIDQEIDRRMYELAERDAYAEYWDNPYYRYTNRAGYEVAGSDDAGWHVRDPDGNPVGDWYRDRESAEGSANQNAMERGLVDEGETQYHDYQLPLGENYREILLQNQVRQEPNFTNKERQYYDFLVKKMNTPKTMDEIIASGSKGPLTSDEIKFMDEFEARIEKQRKREEFTEGHWSEPDVIAHMRVQDRILTDGKPMLYVDEMQSDWHQEGLKHGYKSKDFKQRYDEVYNEYTRQGAKISAARNKAFEIRAIKTADFQREFDQREGRMPTPAETRKVELEAMKSPEYIRWADEAERLEKEREPISKEYKKLTNAVPDAPFKENWHELGIKRMLNYAAKNGYDRIGFSSASPQIKRWGTQEIAWEKAPKIENNFESYKSFVKNQLPSVSDETIAKSWADKDDQVYAAFINELKKPEGWKVVATEQRGGMAGRVNLEAEARARGILKESPGERIDSQKGLRMIIENTTRGMSEEQIDRLTKKTWERMQKFDTGISAPREEGMRAFYDQKMKNTLQKYAEKIGAKFYESSTKVGRGVGQTGYADINEPVYVIEFTDKAKKSAIKGQAYKKGGKVKKMRQGGPLVADYDTIPDINDGGAIKLAAYEQELKRYA